MTAHPVVNKLKIDITLTSNIAILIKIASLSMKFKALVLPLNEKLLPRLYHLWYMVHENGRTAIARNAIFRQCEGSIRVAPKPLSANKNGRYFKLPK